MNLNLTTRPLKILLASFPTASSPLPISFPPVPVIPTREERVGPPISLDDTTIPVDIDGLYNEIVARFWHRDLTRKFELEVRWTL